jgi:protein-tyrosine phosphatase
MPLKVMFVCLGNICRSPLARALFEKHVNNSGLQDLFHIDSAGTSGNHVGENADSRTLENARKNGLSFSHSAKKFRIEHLETFDLIVVMDRSNERNVKSLSHDTQHHEKVHLMRKWDADAPEEDVPDPWYGGPEGFEAVFQILNRSTAALLQDLTTV